MAQLSYDLEQIDLHDDLCSKKGFVVHPFVITHNTPAILIRPDIFLSYTSFEETVATVPLLPTRPSELAKELHDTTAATDKDKFLDWAKTAVRRINEGELQKVVLSAVMVHYTYTDDVDVFLFQKLHDTYTQVMIYLINTPATGRWLGATPELLLKFNEQQLETTSLAGTRFDTGNNQQPKWSNKEIREQQVVTQHILYCFKNHLADGVHVSETRTVSTGHLLHLKTDFLLTISDRRIYHQITHFLRALHPTPAVAGYPQDVAIGHILNTEPHPRAYYTGFLGPLNMHQSSHLYVNLRCMKFCPTGKLLIYSGAGILGDSVPEKEWTEIQLKSQTLLKLL